MSHPEPKPNWALALGRIPSGLFIVTVRHGTEQTGMLASWVQQCSFEPPQVSLALRKGRVIADWMASGAPFSLHVLGEGQSKLVSHFGKGFELGQSAFEGLEVIYRDGLAPLLPQALAVLDCRAAGRFSVGDHDILIGTIHDGQILHDGRPTVHIRRHGTHY